MESVNPSRVRSSISRTKSKYNLYDTVQKYSRESTQKKLAHKWTVVTWVMLIVIADWHVSLVISAKRKDWSSLNTV